jgi:hypothetical protein
MVDLLLTDPDAEAAVYKADSTVSFFGHRTKRGLRSVFSRWGGGSAAAAAAAAPTGKAKEEKGKGKGGKDEEAGCVLL